MFLISSLILVLVVVLILIVGFLLPPTKVYQVSRVFQFSSAQIEALILDVESQPNWRPELVKVQSLGQSALKDGWKEYFNEGNVAISFQLEEHVPGKLIKLKLQGSTGFYGLWTGEFKALNDGQTQLTSTEVITNDGIFGRLIGLFVPIEASMKSYLQNLDTELKHRHQGR